MSQKINIGYQLYSARQEVEQDMDSVLKALSEMGYRGVEFAGFFGHSAKQINKMLEKYDLQAISSHVPVAEMKENLSKVLSFHRKINCPYVVVPYLEEAQRPGQPGFAEMIRFISQTGRKCYKKGIGLLYHNHDFEFEMVSGCYGLDFLFAAVPEKYLATEIDTCWVKYAGVDPAEYLRKYKGRAPMVHIKDFVGEKGGDTPYDLIGQEATAHEASGAAFAYRPLGHGCQDVPGLIQAGLEAGVEWFIVEQDDSPDRPPLEAAKMSIETLLGLSGEGK